MKKLHFTFLLLFTFGFLACKEVLKNDHKKDVLLVGKPEPVIHDGWRKMGDFFNENATYQYLFVLRGKAYFRINMNYQDLESDFWEYDPIANSFSPKKPLPTKNGGSLYMSIGDKGYYGPGLTFYNGVYTNTNEFWEYNPDINNWSRKADFIVDDIEFPGVFVIGNNGYVCGWQSKAGYRYIADTYEYNSVKDSWSKKNALYPLHKQLTTTLQFGINGNGYLFGGLTVNLEKAGDLVDSLYSAIYDPATDQFARVKYTTFPHRYAPQTSWIVKDKIYLYCGGKDYNFFTSSNEIWEFNTVDKVWKRIKDFNGPIRHGSFGFSIGEKTYICFGNDTGLLQYNDIWEHNL